MQLVNLINIFVKNKNLSYSNLGKARSYSYDGLGNRIGIKEYESKIGYGEDRLKTIMEENLSELTPSYEENYILDRTRAYHNILQNKTIRKGSQAIQSYVQDCNVAYINVKNLEDYAGLFIGGSINLAVGVEGGAIAPALTLNPVYSEIIAGEGLGGGAGVGITWYKQLSEGWVYGEAPINWHNPRLSYPFGFGSLIANSNNFCKSNVQHREIKCL